MSVRKKIEEVAREAAKEAVRAVDLGKHDVAQEMHEFAAKMHGMLNDDEVPGDPDE